MVAERGQLEAVVELVTATLVDRLLGVWLYGSAIVGGLKPASDLDLFVLTSRRTTTAQRRRLIDGLRPLSARDARPAGWRPVELSVVALPDIVPWRHPPRMDFISGEWLRAKFDAGEPTPVGWANPDLAVLVAQVWQASKPLVGPPVAEVLDAVPDADLRRGMTESIGSLLADLETDTTNVLLTLARIWYTLESGEFAPKDAAADWALERLPMANRRALELSRDSYLGHAPGSWREPNAWEHDLPAARSAAGLLVSRIESVSAVATIHER